MGGLLARVSVAEQLTDIPSGGCQALAQAAGGQGGAGVWYHQALSKGNGLLQQWPERTAGREDMGRDMKTSDTLYLLSPLCSPPLLTPPPHSSPPLLQPPGDWDSCEPKLFFAICPDPIAWLEEIRLLKRR